MSIKLSRKHAYLIAAIVLIVIAAGIIAFLFYAHQAASPGYDPVPLSTIPSPAGWEKVHTGDTLPTFQSVDFNKLSTSTGSDNIGRVIEVTMEKYNTPVEALIDGSGLYGSFTATQTWNTVNGYLILGIAPPAQMIYLIIVHNRNNPDYEYSFSLSSALANGMDGLGTAPVDPDDVKTLQTMVRNFAESLPPVSAQ